MQTKVKSLSAETQSAFDVRCGVVGRRTAELRWSSRGGRLDFAFQEGGPWSHVRTLDSSYVTRASSSCTFYLNRGETDCNYNNKSNSSAIIEHSFHCGCLFVNLKRVSNCSV